ncbi:hypothetical protein VP01_252g2 [Puccinia sorghi]|uniref:Uncharacterized protein n=1 Tax=Puccinia sorghi TaxID=27349 RepID=A0A0L6V781_9BASI|nr:hypothetical protein VP01_252g2 [Puccinia sorghi]
MGWRLTSHSGPWAAVRSSLGENKPKLANVGKMVRTTISWSFPQPRAAVDISFATFVMINPEESNTMLQTLTQLFIFSAGIIHEMNQKKPTGSPAPLAGKLWNTRINLKSAMHQKDTCDEFLSELANVSDLLEAVINTQYPNISTLKDLRRSKEGFIFLFKKYLHMKSSYCGETTTACHSSTSITSRVSGIMWKYSYEMRGISSLCGLCQCHHFPHLRKTWFPQKDILCFQKTIILECVGQDHALVAFSFNQMNLAKRAVDDFPSVLGDSQKIKLGASMQNPSPLILLTPLRTIQHHKFLHNTTSKLHYIQSLYFLRNTDPYF